MTELELARNFPELNPGQLQMLQRYIQDREDDAVLRFRLSSKR